MANNIPTPKSKLVIETSTFSDSKGRHKKYVNEHPFNAATVGMERQKALEGAVHDIIENKLSQRQAARKWGVKQSTLADRMSGRVAMGRRSGPPPILTPAEESKLADWLINMTESGRVVTNANLFKAVKHILDKDGRDNPLKHKDPPNLPGDKWYRQFLKRNPNVKMVAGNKPEQKKVEVTKEQVDQWFADFTLFLSNHGLSDKCMNIWNCDEYCFSIQVKTGKILGPTNRSTTSPQITGNSKSRISVVMCVNAAGGFTSPYHLFPLKTRPRTWDPLAGDQVGSSCDFTEAGLMDSQVFYSWLSNHFVNHIPPARPVVLLYSTHKSHLDFDTFRFAEENQILLYRLLPKASHLIQPCEGSLFSPLTYAWPGAVSEYIIDNPEGEVSKKTFARVFCTAWKNSVTMQNIIDGFRCSGIYPLDVSKIKNRRNLSRITILNAVIEGYHVFQTHPPENVELLIKKEYGNGEHSLMIYLPELADIPEGMHDVITDDVRQLKLAQVASLPMGVVPSILNEGLYKCMFQEDAKVTCCVSGNPRQNIPPPGEENEEEEDSAVIPASYHIYVDEDNCDAAYSHVQAAVAKLNEKSTTDYPLTIEILLPGCKHFPTELAESLPSSEVFYHVKNLPISEFITIEFINRFIKKGKFYALSRGPHIDTGNVVAVLPTGILLLSVDKDTYEELGLVGTPSQFNIHKKQRKFVIEIDLTATAFHPGKKNYERVSWCLKDRLDLNFDFYLSWDPSDKKGRESIASFFQNYKCEEVPLKLTKQRLTDTAVPVINSDNLDTTLTDDGSCQQCNAWDFYEWLGAMACQVDCSVGQSDGFVSRYTCPDPQHVVDHAVSHQYVGYVTPNTVEKLLDNLRLYVKSSKKTPWASITVHGFMDSPVSWKNREHGFYVSGENLYTFVVFPDDKYWLFMNVSSHDLCP
ncbi:uncharacterized protein LOC144437939 [Glandiceps talaboti]